MLTDDALLEIKKRKMASPKEIEVKLLVADDEPDMLQTLERLLEMSFPDCQILTAANGEDAYDVTMRESPVVILADFKMPRLGGFDLARRLEEGGCETPILLMTAFADSSLEAEARKLPLVQGFFKKPIDPPALISAIETLLEETPDDSASDGCGKEAPAGSARPGRACRDEGAATRHGHGQELDPITGPASCRVPSYDEHDPNNENAYKG